MKIGAELRQGDFAEPAQQQSLGIVECLPQSHIDGLFDQTAGGIGAIAHGQYLRPPQRVVDVAQRDGLEIAGDRPTAAVPFFGMNEPPITQSRHDATDHDRVRAHRTSECFGCLRTGLFRHVQEHVKHTG